MSSIPQSFYVDVNINYEQTTQLVGNVTMSVLISQTATKTQIYTSLSQVASDYTLGTEPEYLAAQMYFNNGGQSLLIYQQQTSTSDEDTITALLNSYSDFIWVTFVENKTVEQMQTISTALLSSTQGLPKFLAQTTNIANAPTQLNAQGITNVALLYSSQSQSQNVIPYSAIIIPAYFSSINLSSPNSLNSIVFTQVNGVSPEDISTTELESLYEGNWNVVVNLGNRYVILDGGKMVNGEPIHSAWGFAIFKQDCENVVTDLIVNKLPYVNSSNSIIENALSGVCNKFVTNGLIGIEKIYNQPTQTVTYNGINYETITQGTVLPEGYTIYSIPISNASSDDISKGRIPPVYVYAVINDIIRLVEITGEVTK